MLRAGSLTTRDPIEIRPAVDSSSPATMRSVVVFPHPDGPSRVTNSPASTRRSMPSTATKPPNARETFSRTRSDTTTIPLSEVADVTLDQAKLNPPEQEHQQHHHQADDADGLGLPVLPHPQQHNGKHFGADRIEQHGCAQLTHDAEERQHPSDGEGRPRKRDQDPPKRLPQRRAVNPGALFEIEG